MPPPPNSCYGEAMLCLHVCFCCCYWYSLLASVYIFVCWALELITSVHVFKWNCVNFYWLQVSLTVENISWISWKLLLHSGFALTCMVQDTGTSWTLRHCDMWQEIGGDCLLLYCFFASIIICSWTSCPRWLLPWRQDRNKFGDCN